MSDIEGLLVKRSSGLLCLVRVPKELAVAFSFHRIGQFALSHVDAAPTAAILRLTPGPTNISPPGAVEEDPI